MRMFVAVLMFALLVGCARLPGPDPSTSMSAPSTVTPTPSTLESPSLRPDGIAKVVPDKGLVVWRVPSADRADRLKNPLPAGAVVYLTQGPQAYDGTAWWEVQEDYEPGHETTFGWVPGSDAAGDATLVAVPAACPIADGPIDTGSIKMLGTLVSLACFGNRELEMRGLVSCFSASVDSMVGGPSWLGVNWVCDIDSVLGLHGESVGALLAGRPPNPTTGRFAVRGHFDDPEAKACSWIPFGTSVSSPVGPPDPGAVIMCRQLFVVTSVTKIDRRRSVEHTD
jgi:hypothetical protein